MEDTYAAATSMKAIQEGLTRLIQAKSVAKSRPSKQKRARSGPTRLSTAEQVAEVQVGLSFYLLRQPRHDIANRQMDKSPGDVLG